MLYYLVRIILLAALLGVSYIFIRRAHVKKKKRTWLWAVLLSFLIVTLSSVFPVENLLVTFRTPEEASRYAKFRGDIDGILRGENSCMILYSHWTTSSTLIVKRSGEGYKLTGNFDVQNISTRWGADKPFGIQHVRGTQDYYVSCPLWGPEGQPSEPEIFDRDGNQLVVDKLKVGNIGYWYMYFPEDPAGYTLLCDGQKYVIP